MQKINRILQEWPSGTVVTTGWLKKRGAYRQLVDVYQKSGWIERIGPGAYKRKGDKIKWTGGLYALQNLQKIDIHIGGKTSLELQGHRHYLRMGNHNDIVMWKKPEHRLPTWFTKNDWRKSLKIRSVNLFREIPDTLQTLEIEKVDIKVSSVERAILEYLHDVPRYEGLYEANFIMKGITKLNSSRMQVLLEECESVKTKRLFMYLGEYHKHKWIEKLHPAFIDFGKGKREIVKGGKLDKKYLITMPDLYREGR